MTIHDDGILFFLLLKDAVLSKISSFPSHTSEGDEAATVTQAPRSVAATTVGPWSWQEPNSALLLFHDHMARGTSMVGQEVSKMWVKCLVKRSQIL